MLNLIIRTSLLLCFLSVSFWQYYVGNWGNGIFFTFLSLIIGFTFWKNERIIMALWHLRKNNLQKAEKQLISIKSPDIALIRGQKASYYFLMGVVRSQNNLSEAEKYFSKALVLGGLSKQEKAMAKLQLAAVYVQKNRKTEAERLISEAKKLDKSGLLKEQISMLKEGMKRASQPGFYMQQQARGIRRR